MKILQVLEDAQVRQPPESEKQKKMQDSVKEIRATS